jgi:hypothetical protein
MHLQEPRCDRVLAAAEATALATLEPELNMAF